MNDHPNGNAMPTHPISFRINDKLLKLLDKFSHENRSEIIAKALNEYLAKVVVVKCPRCKGAGVISKKTRKKGRFI